VPLLALDGYARAQGLGRIAFVKVDVQGYELEVCRGMVGLLEDHAGLAVAVEYAPSAMRAQGFEAADLLALFASRGFAAHLLEQDGRLLPAGVADLARAVGQRGYVDVVFTRGSLV
jgi:hypothetical protein